MPAPRLSALDPSPRVVHLSHRCMLKAIFALLVCLLCLVGATNAVRAQVPAAPTGLTSVSGTSKINLTWNAVSGATSYNLYRGDTSGSETALSGGTGLTATSYLDQSGIVNSVHYYYYKVTAVNASGESAQSAETVAIPLAVPTVTARAGNNQVTLSWTNVPLCYVYNIYRGNSSGSETLLYSGMGGLSYTDTTANNGTTYWYQVTAVRSPNESDRSTEVSAAPLATLPGTPTLTAVPTATQVVLSWTSVAGATSYKVRRSTARGNYSSVLTSPTTPTYTDTPPAQNTSYYYVVTAVAGSTEGAYSNEVVASIPSGASIYAIADAYVEQDTPTTNYGASSSLFGLTNATAARYSYLKFDLSSLGGAVSSAKLHLYRGGGQGAADTIYSVSDTSWIESAINWNNKPAMGSSLTSLTPATNGQWYDFDVSTYVQQAQNAGAGLISFGLGSAATVGTGANYASKEHAFAPQLLLNVGAPPAPLNLTATAGARQISLAWNSVRGATSYNVYRAGATGAETTPAIATGLTSPGYLDTPLNLGSYFYKVSAVNANGESVWSNEASATVVNQAPTVATAAAASPSPATGTTTALSVLGADDGGEANLTYTWATTGTPPAAVSFSANGTNASKSTTATFTKAGSYSFQVTIKDSGNLTVTSSVNVTVNQTTTTITVTPASAALHLNGAQTFSASAKDQFAIVMTSQPTFVWTVDSGGVGTIGSANGAYTAATTAGTATVRATAAGKSGTATVTVTNAAPTVATAASASPSPATGTTTTLSVLGADDGGEANLTYTWATTGTPPAAVSFSANGTNGAKSTTATFIKAGSYSFQVTIKDSGNLTVASSVNVTVSQTLTSIAVTPASASVAVSGTQQFTAIASDQFAQALSSQPTFTWSVGGGGTIGATGLFTAGSTAGGPYTVTASSGGKTGNASVTVGAVPDFTLTASQYNLTIPAGSSLTDTIFISKFNAFSGPITFSAPSLPAGVTVAVTAPNPTTAASAIVTLSVAAGTAATSSPLPITIQGVSGALTHTTVVYLTIAANGAPASLAASPGSSRVSLTWGACAGATTYTVYRGTASGSETSYKTGLTTPSYLDTAVTNGVRYYYFVTATYSGTESAHSNEAAATPQGIANGLAIDSGDLTPPEYVDTGLGHHTWALDEAYSGGSVVTVGSGVTIAGTSDPALFRTQRVGSTFSYSVPVNNGGYQVNLYFAEIQGLTTGQRKFNVALNGSQVLTNYDIVGDTGAQNTAVAKSYPVNVTNGSLNITFTGTTGNAAVGAILITPQIGSVVVDNPPPGWADGVVPTTAATGIAEEEPGPDLEVYNPIGPDASYERYYRNTRPGFPSGYGSPGLSTGWTDNYDLTATDDGTGTLTLHYTNGGTDVWTNSAGTLSVPTNVPYTVSGTRSGSTWTNLAMLLSDSSQYQFTLINGSTTTYALHRIANVLGQGVTINRDASNRLLTIDNDASTHLLQFAYSGSYLSTVTDATDAAHPRQVTYTFGANGLSGVSQINQPSLAQWQYGYDLFNGLPYLTSTLEPNPVGSGMSQSTILYDAAGHVLEEYDPVGRHMFMLHGTASTLIQAYDANNNLAIQWLQNFTGASGYDGGFTDAFSHTETIQYTDPNNPTCPTLDTNRNGAGHTTTGSYDTLGRIQSVTNPFGISANIGYTTPTAPFPKGLPSSVQIKNAANASLTSTTYTYYPTTNTATGAIAGYVQTAQTPQPGVPGATVTTTYTYTALGNIKRIVGPGNNAAPAGIEVDYDYINGYSASTTEKLGQPVKVTVTGIGTSDTTSDYYNYDPHGNITAEIDALGNETDYVYDVFDQLTDSYEPPSDPTQPTKRVHTITTYKYNRGPVSTVSVYEEDGVTLKQRVSYNYNAAEELTSASDLLGSIVSYSYDGFGRVSAMADGVGGAHVTRYGYDAADNLINILYPGYVNGSVRDWTKYTYDNDGNVHARFDGNLDVGGLGVETDYVRDATKDDRITNIQYPSFPAMNVTYGYDAFDRLNSVSNAGATKSYTLDDLGMVMLATTTYAGMPSLPISYTYWPNGSRQTMTVPLVGASGASANYSYLYDGVGRLTQVKFPWTGSSYTYSYENNGWLKRTQGPRTRTLYGYNGRGLLTSLRNYSYPNNAMLSSFTGMTYDSLGDRLTQSNFVASQGLAPDMSRTLAYTYDARGQLLEDKSTKSSGAYTGATYDYLHSYDLAGNTTKFRNTTITPNFNANNQFGDTSQFIYDGNGNPTTYNGSAFTFDQENRLTSASGAAAFGSWYDPDGLRGWKNAGGSTSKTYYLYDGDTPVLEVQPSGSSWVPMAANGDGADGIRSRYYPPTSPLALAGYGSQDYSYTFDPQGNLVQRHLSGASNTDAMDTVLYDGYGMQIADVDAITGNPETPPGGGSFFDPVGFGGQYGYYGDKETGLQLLTHRYYDSGHGRFVNRDPIGYNGGINLYGYASNNPISHFDPAGTNDDDDGPEGSYGMLDKSDAHGGSRPYNASFIHTIHRGAGVAYQGAGMIADSLPGMDKVEAVTGKDAVGNQLSPATRALSLIPILGSVVGHKIGFIPKVFSRMGTDMEKQFATWLSRKGAIVVTAEHELTFFLDEEGKRGKTIFDGMIGKLLYEVKSKVHLNNLGKDIEQYRKQSAIAKRENKNYRVFIKGDIPPAYARRLQQDGIPYTQLPEK